MAGIFCIHWRVEPAFPPRPIRHCGTCGQSRAFRSSGKTRLNANGRRLDAWLIYKCESCDRTWNLPLLERAAVALVNKDMLEALQHSDPVRIRIWEHDLALLGRHSDRIDIPPRPVVTSDPVDLPADWPEIRLVIDASFAGGERLDRLLAGQLGLTRAEVRAMWQAGGLVSEGGVDRALRKPLRGRMTLRLVAARLPEVVRQRLTRAFGGA
jgi:hypothetical protein